MTSKLSEFEQYLVKHHVEALRLSIVAGVRYATVWNAMKEKPVTAENARKIRDAVSILTGVPYIGALMVFPNEPLEKMSTRPMKKWTTYH
jgi:hypothetical protein